MYELQHNLFSLIPVMKQFICCSCLVHLSRSGAEVGMFAPDVTQMHVIDHSKGAPAEGESRSDFYDAQQNVWIILIYCQLFLFLCSANGSGGTFNGFIDCLSASNCR